MNIHDVPAGLLRVIDAAARGRISELRAQCETQGWALDLTCVTHLEGLPEGEMKLRVTASDGERVTIFLEAPIEGRARELGRHLYLTEQMSSARRSLASAERCLRRASEE